MANDIRYKNFKRFPKECIIKKVPVKEFMDNTGTSMDRQGDYLDIIKQGNYLSFMPSHDNMEYFNDSYPDILRVNWIQENIVGGKLI